MITNTDIKMIRYGILCNLKYAVACIRNYEFTDAKEYTTYAEGMAGALYACDGGPGIWASINRVNRLLYARKAKHQGY